MVAATALRRASCFFEDAEKNFVPYDSACHHFAEVGPALVPPSTKSHFPADQVLLNVYELVAFGRINRLTAPERYPIGGALHVGVEVYGREWSYAGGDGSPGTGVICEVPRSNRRHRFRETVALAQTPLSDSQVALVIGELVENWRPEDYHWLHRNCLAFANELCQRLQVGRIPAWIDRFARGAGVVDLSVRGLAGGLAESVHGMAASAQELVRAIVEGPRSCATCVPASGCTAGVAVCEVDPGSSGLDKICMPQAWRVPRIPVVRAAATGVECEGPGASDALYPGSLFEDVHDPADSITYTADATEEVLEAAEALPPESHEPGADRGSAMEEEKPVGHGMEPCQQAARLEPWFRVDTENSDPLGTSCQAGRLQKWFQMEETKSTDFESLAEAAEVAPLAVAREGAPLPPPPPARGSCGVGSCLATATGLSQDKASQTPTPARARRRAIVVV